MYFVFACGGTAFSASVSSRAFLGTNSTPT